MDRRYANRKLAGAFHVILPKPDALYENGFPSKEIDPIQGVVEVQILPFHSPNWVLESHRPSSGL